MNTERSDHPKRGTFGEMIPAVVGLAVFAIVFMKLWWVRDAVLVCWVYGPGAYIHGMRVASGNPQRFTDGQLVPALANVVSGFLFFVVFAICFVTLLVLGVVACEMFRRRRRRNAV